MVRICSGCGNEIEEDEYVELMVYTKSSVVTTVYHDLACLKKALKRGLQEEPYK